MLDKTTVKTNFSRSAKYYDKYCSIQKLCAKRLIDELDGKSFRTILDIGCGTGNLTKLLISRFPNAKIKAVDISKDMIKIASKKIENKGIEFIVKDAEKIALNELFDLISSNAVFQWFIDLENTLAKFRDLLSDDGILIFSMFGPKTFKELNSSLKELHTKEISISADDFIDRYNIETILRNLFSRTIIKEEFIKEEHNTLLELLTKIKWTGTRGSGINIRRLWTPNLVSELEKVYRQRFGRLIATYHVLICKAEKVPRGQK